MSSIAHHFIEFPSPSTPCGAGGQWMYFALAGSLCWLQMVYKNKASKQVTFHTSWWIGQERNGQKTTQVDDRETIEPKTTSWKRNTNFVMLIYLWKTNRKRSTSVKLLIKRAANIGRFIHGIGTLQIRNKNLIQNSSLIVHSNYQQITSPVKRELFDWVTSLNTIQYIFYFASF